MKLQTLRLKNLTSYKEEIINFDQFEDLTVIIGENGAGKSSITDGMTIALFNRARSSTSTGAGVEKLINNGQDFLEVEFEFEIDGQQIRVIRRRFAKGGQELELFIDDANHTDKIKETQAKLDSIIKMDYETFLDTVCISQGKSGSFMEKPANERKEIFTQILSLDKYDVLQDYTKELRKESKDKAARLKEKLEDIVKVVKNKKHYQNLISDGKQEINDLGIDISLKEHELEEVLKEKTLHEQLVKSRNEVIRKQQDLAQKVKNIEENVEKHKNFKSQCEKIIANKSDIDSSLDLLSKNIRENSDTLMSLISQESTLNGTNNVLRGQAKEIKEKHVRLENYNEASCNFCGQDITESHKQQHLDDMMKEAKSYLVQIKNNTVQIEDLNSQISELKRNIQAWNSELSGFQQKKSQIEQAETKLTGVENRLIELEVELNNANSEYAEALSVQVDDIENKTFNDFTIRNELSQLRNQLSSQEREVAVAENELKKIEKEESNLSKLEDELKEVQEEYAILDDLTTAFSKEGIQAIIIDNSLDDIQTEINDVLKVLTNDQVDVEFITQKEKGKGKKATSIETLDIIVNSQDGSRAYETYSGGEKFRIDFACHVGLAKFLSKRAGASIDFFIVDEGVGSQDSTAKDNFVTVMNKITSFFDKVMVITHIPDVIDSFHNKVEVYKDPIQGSKVKILK